MLTAIWLTQYVLLFLALLTQLLGQGPPTFEVASIKHVKAEGLLRGGCRGIDSNYPPQLMASAPPLGRCVITDCSLSQMLGLAYKLPYIEMLKGGPAWAREEGIKFKLDAKAEDPEKATDAQLYRMLQQLLIERFKVKLHTETPDVPGFALVVVKNGPKLQEAKGDEPLYF
jgi:uncharacterized protein (TIGR03435 family)